VSGSVILTQIVDIVWFFSNSQNQGYSHSSTKFQYLRGWNRG